jgi:hypothetical protein
MVRLSQPRYVDVVRLSALLSAALNAAARASRWA